MQTSWQFALSNLFIFFYWSVLHASILYKEFWNFWIITQTGFEGHRVPDAPLNKVESVCVQVTYHSKTTGIFSSSYFMMLNVYHPFSFSWFLLLLFCLFVRLFFKLCLREHFFFFYLTNFKISENLINFNQVSPSAFLFWKSLTSGNSNSLHDSYHRILFKVWLRSSDLTPLPLITFSNMTN